MSFLFWLCWEKVAQNWSIVKNVEHVKSPGKPPPPPSNFFRDGGGCPRTADILDIFDNPAVSSFFFSKNIAKTRFFSDNGLLNPIFFSTKEGEKPFPRAFDLFGRSIRLMSSLSHTLFYFLYFLSLSLSLSISLSISLSLSMSLSPSHSISLQNPAFFDSSLFISVFFCFTRLSPSDSLFSFFYYTYIYIYGGGLVFCLPFMPWILS